MCHCVGVGEIHGRGLGPCTGVHESWGGGTVITGSMREHGRETEVGTRRGYRGCGRREQGGRTAVGGAVGAAAGGAAIAQGAGAVGAGVSQGGGRRGHGDAMWTLTLCPYRVVEIYIGHEDKACNFFNGI